MNRIMKWTLALLYLAGGFILPSIHIAHHAADHHHDHAHCALCQVAHAPVVIAILPVVTILIAITGRMEPAAPEKPRRTRREYLLPYPCGPPLLSN